MEIQIIDSLLSEISSINREYKKVAELTGENFNIFKILGLSTREVRTHSAFLGELLNPRGSHGQKEIFLKLFCDEMHVSEFDCNSAKVSIEKFIGYKTIDSGGFIDIIIIDKNNNAIIIENKIFAGDQENQLIRYFNYSKCHKYSELFYLTLEGKDASEFSKSQLKAEDFKRISYSHNILIWLERCKEKAVTHPILRETLTQYIYLIKHLTNKTSNSNMENEIANRIAISKSFLEATFLLVNNLNTAKNLLLKKLIEQLDLRAKEAGFYIIKEDLSTSINARFSFSNELLLKHNIRISFQSFKGDVRDIIYGVFHAEMDNGTAIPMKDELAKIILSKYLQPYKPTGWTPGYMWYKNSNWDNIETYSKILDGELAKEIIEETSILVNICINAIEELNLKAI